MPSSSTTRWQRRSRIPRPTDDASMDFLSFSVTFQNTRLYWYLLLVAIVLLAGVLTTSVIVRRYEASLPVSEEIRRGTRDLEYR